MSGFKSGKPLRLITAILLIVQLAVSAPSSREKRAAPACSNEVSNSLKYETGKTYNYDFESEVITKIVGGSDEDSRLKVKGQAALATISSCEYILTIVKLESPSHQAASGLSAAEKTSLKFTFQNGKIDPESISLAKDDPVWSANIKRAIVSLLQNSALGETDVSSMTFRETDVTGANCLTKYTITGSNYVKTKDLNLCGKRDGGLWISQGLLYQTAKPRAVQSGTTFKSSQSCTQDYGSGKLQSTQCTETHKVEIFNKGGAGVETSVTTSLKLTGDTAGNPHAGSFQGTEPTGIAFDHSDDSDTGLDKSAAGAARKVLEELCKDVEGGILGTKVAGLYVDLRKQMTHTAVDDLRAIYADLTSNKVCSGAEESLKVKILFQDAAATAGTTPAIEFTAKLYDTLDERVQELFRLSIPFAKGPEASAVESVATLLTPGADSRLFLAASGIAHQYCLLTNKNCGECPALNSIGDAIGKEAKDNCQKTDEPSIERAITALQSLGNINALSKGAIDAVTSCLTSKEERVVANALQAFRRDGCEESLKAKAREILSNADKSTDIRILAYLALANCFTETDALHVSTVLQGSSNQVYWFIGSHRHNFLHTDDQIRVTSKARHAFNLIKIPKATSKPDARKYSNNFDLSTFDRRQNLGGTISGNLIYSQDSFVPRTITNSLTLDVWGISYNLAEVGVGLADYDDLATKLFKGAFEDDGEAEAGASSRRRRREVAPPNVQAKDITALQEATKVTTVRKTDGVTDIYVRVLGTTVFAESYQMLELMKEGADAVEHIVERITKALKSAKIDITEGGPYMADDLVVPTISGFPLTIDFEQTAVASLKLDSDLVEGASLKTRFSPSGSVQLRGRIVTGSGPVLAGLQVEGTLHSASDVAAEFIIVPGKTKGFNCDIKVNLPQEKTHLFDVRNELYWISKTGTDVPVKKAVKSTLPQKVLADNLCLEELSKFFGLKYCLDVKLAPLGGGDVPLFPLTGPGIASVTVERSDPSVKDYLFQLHFDNEEKADMHFSVVFDTPGASTSRRIVLTATGVGDRSSPEKNLDIIIESPWKKFTGKGKYTKQTKAGGVIARSATFDLKDTEKTLLKTSYSGDFPEKLHFPYIPLASTFDFDVKYGMQAQHSLSVNTKFANPTFSDLSFEGKVASSRLPPLNLDFKWDRTISWQKLKFNLDVTQGLGGDKNTISLNSLTELDGKGINSKTSVKVLIPAKKLDISYTGNLNTVKATQKATGSLDLSIVPSIKATSSFNLDLSAQSYDLQSSLTAGATKVDLKSAGTKADGADGQKREFTLQVKVEPKVFDLDTKTTVTIAKDGKKFSIQSTTKTSLVPSEISTNLEVSRTDGLKITSQLNLGNDRISSTTIEAGQVGDKFNLVVEKFIQKRLDAKFEAQFYMAGKVSTKLDVTYIPLGRRIKLETNGGYDIGADSVKVDYDASLKWDFDKDPNAGVAFGTSNTFTKSSGRFLTVNTLTWMAKPYKLTIDTIPGKQFLNEEHSWKLSYQAGQDPEHTIGFQFKIDNSATAKKLTAGAQLDLDSVPGVPKEIKMEMGVTDLDLGKFYFDSLSRLTVVSREAGKPKVLEIEFSTKPDPKGRSVRAEVEDDLIFMYGIDATATIGGEGVDVKYVRTLDTKKVTLLEFGASKSAAGKLSEIKTNAVFDRDFSADGPTFKIDGVYSYRFASIWDFEVQEHYTITDRRETAAKNIESTSSAKISPSSLALSSSSSLKSATLNSKADFAISGSLEGKKMSGAVDIKFTNNSVEVQMVKADVSLTPGFPHDSELIFNIALPPVVKYRNIALKIKQEELTKGQTYKNLLEAKINDVQIELTSNVEKGAKKVGDFALKLNKDPVRKLFLAYHPEGPSVEATIRWGDDNQMITTTGKVVPVGKEGFDVHLVFDSSLLPNKKWDLTISRRVEEKSKSLKVELDNAQSKQNLKFGVEKQKNGEDRKYILNYDANLSLPSLRGLLQGQKGNIVLEVDRDAYDKAKEKSGIEVKLDADFNPLIISVLAKKSDLQGKLSVSVCPGPGLCDTGDLLLIQDDLSFEVGADVVRKNVKVGFNAVNKKGADGKSCDTTTKIFYPLAGKQKELGLRYFSEDGKAADLELAKKEISAPATSIRNAGLEITLGPRTISAITSKASWDSDAADADAVQVKIWLDKSREANRALTVLLANVLAGQGKQGRDVFAIASHPDFKKDHKLKTSYRFDSAGPDLFDIKTEIDIFKTTADALVLNTNLKQKVEGDVPVFQVGWSAKSEGQGLSWDVLCSNIKIDDDDTTANCKFDAKSAKRGDRSLTWDFSSSFDSISAKVEDKEEGLIFQFVSSPNKGSDGSKQFQTTLQLPGMKDSWVREIRTISDPKGIAYRGYTSSYPPNKYTEAYVGLFGQKKFGGGTRASEASGMSDITSYSVEILRPDPDIIKVDWSKDNIFKFLDETNTRLDAAAKGWAEFVRKRGNNNAERLQQIVSGFKDALPDPGPLQARVMGVVNELAQEGGGAQQGLLAFASRSKRAAGDDKKIQVALSAAAESAAKSIEALSNARRVVIEKIKALFEKISKWPASDPAIQAMKEPIKSALRGGLEQVRAANLKLQTMETGIAAMVIGKVRGIVLDTFEDAYDENLKDWNRAFPYSDVEQFLNSLPEYLETALLKPNETTDASRNDLYEKLDRAVLQVAQKGFSADFQKGTIVSRLPIAHLLGFGQLDDDNDDDDQYYPTIGLLNIILGLLQPRLVVPPVDAVAVVIGGTHFQTFDGLLKYFGTACQYLLVTNSVDKSFSVAIDIQKKGTVTTQSLVVTDGVDTISISGSPTIYVNGKKSEPGKAGAFNVLQDKRWTSVRGKGVTVTCLRHEEKQLCEIQAAGYLQGKLRGILGNFDNEVFDDKTIPAGTRAEGSENFVNSWRLNKDCKGGKLEQNLFDYKDYTEILNNPNLNLVKPKTN